MAAKKKAGAAKSSGGDLIISKSRTKAAAKKCNVGSEFYGALDKKVRAIIADAEARATGNKRKTLKAVDLSRGRERTGPLALAAPLVSA
jgi:histone H3/H4